MHQPTVPMHTADTGCQHTATNNTDVHEEPMHINKQRPLSRARSSDAQVQKQGAAETNTHKGRRDRQTDHKTVNKQPYAHTHTRTGPAAGTATMPHCKCCCCCSPAMRVCTDTGLPLACWSLCRTERDATPNSTMTSKKNLPVPHSLLLPQTTHTRTRTHACLCTLSDNTHTHTCARARTVSSLSCVP